jgi:hypothetical protein
MKQYGPIGEATFRSKKTLKMEKYRVLSSNQKSPSNSLPPEEMFWLWVLGMKDSIHIWRVEQAIFRAFPSPFHFQLDLDYTKLWCGVASVPKPK